MQILKMVTNFKQVCSHNFNTRQHINSLGQINHGNIEYKSQPKILNENNVHTSAVSK